MSSDARRKGLLVAIAVWIVLIAAVAAIWRFVISPRYSEQLTVETSGESVYQHDVNLALDGFSGYALFSSEEFNRDVRSQGIRVNVIDEPDYDDRISGLKKGKWQMAAFTVDSYLMAGARLGEYPGSIVLVIDESRGADGIVTDQKLVPTLQSLNSPDARFVFVPNSPAEFMARIIIAEMNLPNLPQKWWVEAESGEDVYRQFRANSREKKPWAYVTWQPYLSRMQGEPNAQTVFDSSKLSGYVVDVLVVERKFLRDNPEVVKQIMAAYLRASYSYANAGGIEEVVKQVSKDQGSVMSSSQAADIVSGLVFKNTLENYAHFGLVGNQSGIDTMEDIIGKIMTVLVKTSAVATDPLNGQYTSLFYQEPLRELQAANFHPAKKLNIVQGLGNILTDDESVRAASSLRALSDQEWESLVTVGSLKVESISFARGRAELNVQSERELQALATRLASLPNYYLVVTGQTITTGNVEANKRLAQERADAVASFLIQSGIDPVRIKAVAKPASGEQAVSFVLGQLAY